MRYLMIGEVAKQTGLSVRSLRHWESYGLLTPIRTEARQRAYGPDQLIRINYIQVLKRAGFALKAIKELLESQAFNADQIVAAQISLLEHQQTTIGRSLAALKKLQAGQNLAQELSPAELCNLIKMGGFAMTEQEQQEAWQKVYDKFYTKEEQQAWIDLKEGWSEDDISEAEQRWPSLIARVEQLVAAGTPPSSDAAREVIEEWRALTVFLTRDNPELAQSTGRMYDHLDDWPKDGPEPPFSSGVWAYIKEAADHHPGD